MVPAMLTRGASLPLLCLYLAGRLHEVRAQSAVLDFDGKYLLYDYVPWEQLSKQRRGIMWAWQTARGMGRTLVLPPFRFQTEEGGSFKAHAGATTFE